LLLPLPSKISSCYYANKVYLIAYKIMKNTIVKIVAVAAIVLSFVFSWVNIPAYALSTVPTINFDNFETEVLNSDKPVVVILVSKYADRLPELGGVPENLASQAQAVFGDKYKIVTGINEENLELQYLIPTTLTLPPLPRVGIFNNGDFKYGSGTPFPPSNSKDVFESVKKKFEGNA